MVGSSSTLAEFELTQNGCSRIKNVHKEAFNDKQECRIQNHRFTVAKPVVAIAITIVIAIVVTIAAAVAHICEQL